MHISVHDLAQDAHLEGDLCIIGGGAAGITIAREYIGTPINVLLLESGAFELNLNIQDLYNGELSGNVLSQETRYPQTSRLRYFGGSTNHWDGWCRPFDPLDFERRSWVSQSGWPFGYETLAPYYARAAGVVEIKDFTVPVEERQLSAPPLFQGEPAAVTTEFYHYSPPTRFGKRYRDELVNASNVRIVTEASVMDIALNPDGTAVQRLHAGSLDGRRFTVNARRYILACGGIENARLLLASSTVHRHGIGNQNDLVGRYFSDHPHARGLATLLYFGSPRALGAYKRSGDKKLGLKACGTMCITPEWQRREALLNLSVEFRTVNTKPKGLRPEDAEIARLLKRTDEDLRGTTGEVCYISLLGRAEQAPNPDSRVTLISERDALGMPRVRVNWQMQEQDVQSMRRSLEIIGAEFGRRFAGRIALHVETPRAGGQYVAGKHHMGTTRMHQDPKKGVVDANGKVHGVGNLYVAGSSLFPTVSYANPTFTIVALALRLAEHLQGELRP